MYYWEGDPTTPTTSTTTPTLNTSNTVSPRFFSREELIREAEEKILI
jgi:hypothetical protein